MAVDTYFAYGSNLLLARLRQDDRAPSAKRIGIAAIDRYSLRFHKVGADGSGKCDAFGTGVEGDCLHGCLYEIEHEEWTALDRAEGVGYLRTRLEVRWQGQIVAAQTYVAREHHHDPSLLPFDWYLELVLAGARESGLPEAQIERLEGIRATRDPDRARFLRHRALLATLPRG